MTRPHAATAALAVLFLLAAGCSGKTTPVRTYLMRASYVEPSGAVGPAVVGIAPVVVASYLDQPGLTLQTSPHEIDAAQFHRWAEPLGAGIRATLRAELARITGANVSADSSDAADWTHAVVVHVDQLHGTQQGEALLVASYRITAGLHGPTLGSHRFEARQALAEPGHEALVAAEVALVGQLAESIAGALRVVPAPSPGP